MAMSAMFIVEPEICQEAVLGYYHGVDSGMKKSHDLSLKAKKHLSAMGWGFSYVMVHGIRQFSYRSPKGKVFYSLKMACKNCIDEGGGLVAMAQEPKSKQSRKRKSLSLENQPLCEPFQSKPPKRNKRSKKQGNQTNPRVMKSSKRVREGPLPNPSHRNPRTILSWLIDNNVVSVMDKVYYRNKAGEPLMRGRITRDGIQCECCFKVFTLTAFEAHAGSTNHRPAANIMLDDRSGMSLSDCKRQVHDSRMVTRSKVESPKTVKGNPKKGESDEICSACRDGGELICCDNCPSAFHANCLGLKEVPDSDWLCPSCCCGICCNGYLTDDSFHTCQQCERRFHVGCQSSKESSNLLKNYQTGKKWFCTQSCKNIFSRLQKLTGKPIPVGKNLTWTLLKCEEACSDSNTNHAYGPGASSENHSKLSLALEVMHECFEPCEDVRSGRDLVEDVIFSRGSNLKQLNFKGFYTVILEQNDDMVSVATVRIYGKRVAEMPLVATRFSHRRQGLCRVLVDQLEKNLAKIGVEKLVLPAVPETLNTWTNQFGFSPMGADERSELLQYTLLDFQGTTMCQKLLQRQTDLR